MSSRLRSRVSRIRNRDCVCDERYVAGQCRRNRRGVIDRGWARHSGGNRG